MADSTHCYVLLEAAAGYALFDVVAMEEIGSFGNNNNNDTLTDLQRFQRAIKLHAFQPFASAAEALENANAISEHAMTSTLQNFLQLNLPHHNKGNSKATKKSSSKGGGSTSFALGVIDPALATAIAEGLDVKCRSDDTIREILRGCRLHLEHLVKGLSASSSAGGGTGTTTTSSGTRAAELGLGHSYSRSRVKFNPARSDNMIIQSIALLDQLDRDVNTFAMRVREWYSWHFPELKDVVKDNILFARAAATIQNKQSLVPLLTIIDQKNNNNYNAEKGDGSSERKTQVPVLWKQLLDIVGDEMIVEQIVLAAKTSMGMECSDIDMLNIVNFSTRMVKLAAYRKQLSLYLTDKMAIVAPNLSALIGDTVAARLISKVRVPLFCVFLLYCARV